MDNWQGNVKSGVFALLVPFLLVACAEKADLVKATEAAARDPEQAMAAQLAPQAGLTKKLQATGVASSTFGASVRNAVITHPALLGQHHKIAGAIASIEGAQAAYRPRMSVGFDAGATASTSSVSGPRIGPVVSLTKLIYDGSAARFTLTSRRQGLVVAKLDRQIEATAIAMRSVEAQANTIRAREMETIAVQNLSDHEILFSKIESRVEAGAGSQADLLAGKSRLASATAQAIESKRNRRQAEATFTEVLGAQPSTSISLPPVLPKHLFRRGSDAARRNPQLVRFDFLINQAIFDLAAVQAGRNPSLIAGVSAGPTVGTSGVSADVSANFGFRIELTSGGEREARVKQAEANVADLNSQRDLIQRQIVRALDFTDSDSAASAERLRAAFFAEAAATAALEAAKDQFAIGRRTITQVLDAQRDQSQSAVAVVDARTEQILVGYAALALTGDLLILFRILLSDDTENRG
jgi:adhesin transport system outer membrane protein